MVLQFQYITRLLGYISDMFFGEIVEYRYHHFVVWRRLHPISLYKGGFLDFLLFLWAISLIWLFETLLLLMWSPMWKVKLVSKVSVSKGLSSLHWPQYFRRWSANAYTRFKPLSIAFMNSVAFHIFMEFMTLQNNLQSSTSNMSCSILPGMSSKSFGKQLHFHSQSLRRYQVALLHQLTNALQYQILVLK